MTLKDFFACFTLFVCLILFYPELFLAKIASLPGDHWEQHYPWAFLLASSLKQGHFPWWTPLIHCGYPITAEGQIGTFYLPNLLLYSFMPFRWAYSYQNVFHFLISGWGTYAYCRQMKLTPLAAWLAAFCYLFGTSYGGAYYNITSLKTLCWFPWSLWCIEKYLILRRPRYLFLFAIFIALALLAGYLQIAAYALLMLGFYIFLRVVFFPAQPDFSFRRNLGDLIAFGLAFAGGVVLAFPQLWMTYKLAVESTRTELTEDYAYVGSLFPGTLLTLVYPLFQRIFRGACVYIGTLPVLFLLIAVLSTGTRKTTTFKLWITLCIISLLLALGEWSPLYIALIKLTRFYSFRFPTKFIIFFCFGIAFLAGLGFQRILEEPRPHKHVEISKGARLYVFLTGLTLVSFIAAYFFISSIGYESMLAIGEQYVQRFIYGRSGHPYDLQTYLNGLRAFLDALLSLLLPWKDAWNLWCYSMMAAGMAFAILLPRASKKIWIPAAIIFIFIDLYVFAWTDIKKDFGRYDAFEKKSITVNKLLEEKMRPNFGRIFGMRGRHDSLPLVPSSNILYGIADIGAYSPLVKKRYFETIGQLGSVNDSNLASFPDPHFILKRLPLLDFLNVSHILSAHSLDDPKLELIAQDSEKGAYLYRNLGNPRQAHFISARKVISQWSELKKEFMGENFDPAQVLLLEGTEPADESGKALEPNSQAVMKRVKETAHEKIWKLETGHAGYLVLSDGFDSGWTVTVNGSAEIILPAFGLFQAVEIRHAGSYEIRFQYSPWNIAKS